MSAKKAFQIIDVQVMLEEYINGYKGMNEVNALCNALYISAKGSNHFYEALRLICTISDEQTYHEEFEKIKNKYHEV